MLSIALFALLCIATAHAFSVKVFQTNPATTEANLDSYNFGMTQKDSSAYWFSNWYADGKGGIKAAFVASTKPDNAGTCCPQRYSPEMTYGSVTASGAMASYAIERRYPTTTFCNDNQCTVSHFLYNARPSNGNIVYDLWYHVKGGTSELASFDINTGEIISTLPIHDNSTFQRTGEIYQSIFYKDNIYCIGSGGVMTAINIKNPDPPHVVVQTNWLKVPFYVWSTIDPATGRFFALTNDTVVSVYNIETKAMSKINVKLTPPCPSLDACKLTMLTWHSETSSLIATVTPLYKQPSVVVIDTETGVGSVIGQIPFSSEGWVPALPSGIVWTSKNEFWVSANIGYELDKITVAQVLL